MHLQYNDAFLSMRGLRRCVEARHEDKRIAARRTYILIQTVKAGGDPEILLGRGGMGANFILLIIYLALKTGINITL